MAKAGWTVQSAFCGQKRHATKESSPTPCREAAQSNLLLHGIGGESEEDYLKTKTVNWAYNRGDRLKFSR